MNTEYFIEDCPEYLISMIRIVPVFRTTSGYNLDDLTFTASVDHYWEKIDNTNFKLYIRIDASLKDDDDNIIPLYVDINLYILNELMNYEIPYHSKQAS